MGHKHGGLAHGKETKRCVSIVAFLLGCTAMGVAQAAEWQTREQEAQRACLTGNPTKGIEILTDLYLSTRDPNHIYNQGRCFEQNRLYDDAIGRFREYMVKAKTLSAEEKADTERHIAACESYLATRQREDSSPAHPETTTLATQPAQSTPASRAGSGLRTAGIVTAAVGGAALVAGVAFALKANQMASDLEKPYGYTDSANSERKSYKAAAYVGYGVGAACVAGGALLYYLGWREQSATTLEPTVAPDRAGVVLTRVF